MTADIENKLRSYTFAITVFLGVVGGTILKIFDIYDLPDFIGVYTTIAVTLHIVISISMMGQEEQPKRWHKWLLWGLFATFILSIGLFIYLKQEHTYSYQDFDEATVRLIKTPHVSPFGDSILRSHGNSLEEVLNKRGEHYAINEKLWDPNEYSSIKNKLLVSYLLVILAYIAFMSFSTHFLREGEDDIIMQWLKKILKWIISAIRSKFKEKPKAPKNEAP